MRRHLLAAALLFCIALPGMADSPGPPPTRATVVAVYDGDTLTLSTGDKVRLRGVNTPEIKPAEDYGIEARDAARDLLLNQEVILTYGPSESVRDGYGRLLASVHTADGRDLALHLLEQGLGHVFLIPPESLDATLLVNAQDTARAAGRGIWSTDRYRGDLHITSFHANAPGDDSQNINGEYLRISNVAPRPVDLAGYSLRDLSGKTWPLPSLIVPVGHTVKVHSGTGANQPDPDQQLEVYLGSSQPIWNNSRDRATIYDRYGQVVDAREHAPQSSPDR